MDVAIRRQRVVTSSTAKGNVRAGVRARGDIRDGGWLVATSTAERKPEVVLFSWNGS